MCVVLENKKMTHSGVVHGTIAKRILSFLKRTSNTLIIRICINWFDYIADRVRQPICIFFIFILALATCKIFHSNPRVDIFNSPVRISGTSCCCIFTMSKGWKYVNNNIPCKSNQNFQCLQLPIKKSSWLQTLLERKWDGYSSDESKITHQRAISCLSFVS